MTKTTKREVYKCWSCRKPQYEQDGQTMRSGMGSVTVCPGCKAKDDAFWKRESSCAVGMCDDPAAYTDYIGKRKVRLCRNHHRGDVR